MVQDKEKKGGKGGAQEVTEVRACAGRSEGMAHGLSLEDLSLFNICLGKQEVALGKEAPLRFELGQEVFVQLYSEKSTGRGHIIGLPEEEVRK